MLLQFNFRNFKSFRDDTTLDLTATKITEYSSHVVPIGNEKLLPVAVIFGANGSGKSNVIDAFKYMATYVVTSFAYGGEKNNKRNSKKGKAGFLKPTPFLFDSNSLNLESSFEVYFVDAEENGNKFYNYGFTVGQNGINEEWLNCKSKSSRKGYKRIFYRDNKSLDLSGITPKSRENIRIALEKETLIVSLGAKLKIPELKNIRDWFLNNEIINFGNIYEGFFMSSKPPDGFVENEAVQKKIVDYFSAFDAAIVGFDVEIIEQSNDDDKTKTVRIDAVHKMIGSEQTATLPLELESRGTLKMFALYQFLKDVLDTGGVFFLDELNSQLHPLLVRAFVTTFLNPEINKKHAQLIFTSHDSWLLNSNLLRRDEVWFTEKSAEGISTLYSLADFADVDGVKIRKDENHAKNYLLGKYGAIPALKHLFREE